jgi:two-component system, OmpR family, copper resistance phosphate regulon response regulator CusR
MLQIGLKKCKRTIKGNRQGRYRYAWTMRVPPQETRICLVEDEIDIATVIKKGLEMKGYTVHEYNDPAKVWEYFQENDKNCTVVLSDVRMPGMSGFEFCRKVKTLRPAAPVILMTAFEINQSEFDTVMPNTKADGFIQKPIALKNLMALIDGLVSSNDIRS